MKKGNTALSLFEAKISRTVLIGDSKVRSLPISTDTESCINVKVIQATQYFSPAIQHTSDYSCWLNKHKPLTLCSDKAVIKTPLHQKDVKAIPPLRTKSLEHLGIGVTIASWKAAGKNDMSKQSGEQTSCKLGLGPQWCDQKLAKFCHVSVH